MNKPTNIKEGFFTDLANTTPYFKAAAEGSAGSGKTFTLAQIAAGLHKHIVSVKPIVIYDTEKSAKFLRPFFAEKNINVLLKDSRTLKDLTDTMDYCNAGNADILIIDSITHVWEQFLNAYQSRKGRQYLQFQDWGFIKPTWKREFSDRLVSGNFHILFTGREGYTYESEINDETGKREIYKSGVKMKVEGDTAYEPDLLFRMERFEEILDKDKKVWREATIIKDRSNLIDGKVFKNPTFDSFLPIIKFLLSDIKPKPEGEEQSDFPLFDTTDDERKYSILKKTTLEEIQGIFDKTGLSDRKAEDKVKKVNILERIFYTSSRTAIENMSLEQLQDARDRLEADEEVKQLTEKM